MAKFLSGRNKNIDVGIESSTENVTVLSVIGNSNLTGDLNVTGVVTATSFSGSGSELTGINPTIGINSGGTNVGTAKTINFGTNLGATISNEVATVTSLSFDIFVCHAMSTAAHCVLCNACICLQLRCQQTLNLASSSHCRPYDRTHLHRGARRSRSDYGKAAKE